MERHRKQTQRVYNASHGDRIRKIKQGKWIASSGPGHCSCPCEMMEAGHRRLQGRKGEWLDLGCICSRTLRTSHELDVG